MSASFYGVDSGMLPYQRRKPEAGVADIIPELVRAAKDGKRDEVASLLNTEDPDERDTHGAFRGSHRRATLFDLTGRAQDGQRCTGRQTRATRRWPSC